MTHVKFALEMCIRQYRAGRFFIFEHPTSASSWGTDMMKHMMSLEGVHTAKFDFCQLGMTTKDEDGRTQAAKKPTAVMTNSANLAEVLRQAQCQGLQRHQHLVGGRASACQVYPQPFVELITEAIKKELRDAQWRQGMATKFDISAPVEKLMSVMQKLEKLDEDELQKGHQSRKVRIATPAEDQGLPRNQRKCGGATRWDTDCINASCRQ